MIHKTAEVIIKYMGILPILCVRENLDLFTKLLTKKIQALNL